MAYTDSTGSFAKKFCSKSPFKTGERTFPENLPPKTGTVQGALTGLVSKGLNKVKKKIQKIRTKTNISEEQPYNPNTD